MTVTGRFNGSQRLVDTASVSGDQPDPDAGDNVATATTAVIVSPEVSTGQRLGMRFVEGVLTGLRHGVTYHYRLVAADTDRKRRTAPMRRSGRPAAPRAAAAGPVSPGI